MTVASTNTAEMTVLELVRAAHRRAGLISIYQSPNQQQLAAGQVELELILKNLNAKGLFARKIDWLTITAVAEVFQYECPATVFDLVGTAMWTDPTQPVTQVNTPDTVETVASSELPVRLASRDQWQSLSPKDATGRPLLYYPHRAGAQVIAYLWPVPGVGEAGGSLRFQAHFWRADAKDANATADVERFWQQYIVYELAHSLAVAATLSLPRLQYLRSLADSALADCRRMSSQRAPSRLIVGHRTGWAGGGRWR